MNRLTASIDLGTNTARLLIGTVENGRIVRHHIARRITRLGGGFSKTDGISREAAARTVAALQEFAGILKEFKVSGVRAVATSAVRDAANQLAFCREIRSTTGIDLEVISGDDEGRLTLLGVFGGLDIIPDYLFVFDVGGGSTEYTLSTRGAINFSRSLPLGVVRLTEGKGSVAGMAAKIERELVLMQESMGPLEHDRLRHATLLGTAGTATTLAAINIGLADYDYEKVNNQTLARSEINTILQRLLPLTPRERLQTVVGLEEGREDLIIAGALLTLMTLDRFGFSSMKVSDFGLLEGILLDS